MVEIVLAADTTGTRFKSQLGYLLTLRSWPIASPFQTTLLIS